MIESSNSAERTEAIGEELAGRLQPGDLVLLEGDLAAGKTTLVRGLVHGLAGNADEVSSPTFVIVQLYRCDHQYVRAVHHVDLYRLSDDLHDLRNIGLDEMLSEADAITAVEWPKHTLLHWLPRDSRLWRVLLTLRDDGSRDIEIIEPQ